MWRRCSGLKNPFTTRILQMIELFAQYQKEEPSSSTRRFILRRKPLLLAFASNFDGRPASSSYNWMGFTRYEVASLFQTYYPGSGLTSPHSF